MNIGHRIKKIRTEQKLTLNELGKKTGLTTSFLSQLERDLTSPSVNSLKKIANALNTTITYFFEEEESKKCIVIKRGMAKRPVDKKNKLFCESLASDFSNRKMQPNIFTIRKGGELTKEFIVQEGERFGMVVRGKLELESAEEKITLEEGDSIYCHSNNKLLRLKNVYKTDSKLLWIIFLAG